MNILCKLGLHKWKTKVHDNCSGRIELCKRCGILRVVETNQNPFNQRRKNK